MAEPCKINSPASLPSSEAGASQQSPTKPLFWMITGSDFGRSINWSKRQQNAVSEKIKTVRSPSSKATRHCEEAQFSLD